MKVKNRTPNPNIGIIQDSLTHPTGLLKKPFTCIQPSCRMVECTYYMFGCGAVQKVTGNNNLTLPIRMKSNSH
jgi:hypothetical protein